MTTPLRKREAAKADFDRATELERKLIGAALFGSAKDWDGLVRRCGFGAGDIRTPVHALAWQVVVWAEQHGLPAAAITVLEALDQGRAAYFDFHRAGERMTPADVLELRRLNEAIPRPLLPRQRLPVPITDLMDSLKHTLYGITGKDPRLRVHSAPAG